MAIEIRLGTALLFKVWEHVPTVFSREFILHVGINEIVQCLSKLTLQTEVVLTFVISSWRVTFSVGSAEVLTGSRQ